ncbi:phage portal protein [Alteribacillus sp. YIM 98480]|uniref:phage portal protein n=1 Tax=Alteribacillus sp. YIM 98480 TaxID=2606599 RepID=UPI00131CA886|nr:phage portal protein [Alteribacillus sp. YIM 98480]
MVTHEQLKEAIKKHKQELPHYQKLYNYYVGKHDILYRKLPDPEKPNNKIVAQYPKKIINTMLGYFASVPISYVSKSDNEDFLNELKLINYLNNEEDENAELAKNFSIFGKCYELYYIDRNGFTRFKHYSPLEMFVEQDINGDILFAGRYWTIRDKDNQKIMKIEVYDTEDIYYFTSTDKGKTFKPDLNERNKEHYFGEVPVSIYQNSEEEIGDFEEFISLVDSIDKLLSDSVNSVESWVNAFLVLGGMQGTTKEDLEKMKQNGALLLEDVTQAKFLTKDADSEFQNNLFETLDNMIHEHSDTPRLTSEGFQSNLSSQALKWHLFGLETKSAMKERKMEKALRKRIRMITKILNMQGKSYDPADIRFKFTRNIPSDESGITDQIVKLFNIIPTETLLSWHPRIQHPENEIKKLQEAQDSMDLESNLQQLNQNRMNQAGD